MPERAGEQAPARIRELAAQRLAARQARDYAAADRLRAEIAQQGWVVTDTQGGYDLVPAVPEAAYEVLPNPSAVTADLASGRSPRSATIGLLVEGWPDDLRECVSALLAHAPAGVMISALDVGNRDGAGDALHELAAEHPARIEALHVAAGWRGADPDPDLQGFHDAGPGQVTALLGYLLAVRTAAAREAGGLPAGARFYRNADLEFSLRLGRSGRLLVPDRSLPVRQARHRGYHDSDPEYRDRESRRNYRLVLELLRQSGGTPG